MLVMDSVLSVPMEDEVPVVIRLPVPSTPAQLHLGSRLQDIHQRRRVWALPVLDTCPPRASHQPVPHSPQHHPLIRLHLLVLVRLVARQPPPRIRQRHQASPPHRHHTARHHQTSVPHRHHSAQRRQLTARPALHWVVLVQLAPAAVISRQRRPRRQSTRPRRQAGRRRVPMLIPPHLRTLRVRQHHRQIAGLEKKKRERNRKKK